jgi:hypothetical protein
VGIAAKLSPPLGKRTATGWIVPGLEHDDHLLTETPYKRSRVYGQSLYNFSESLVNTEFDTRKRKTYNWSIPVRMGDWEMANAWKVIWSPGEGRRKIRRFEGDSPHEAVQFGKSLRRLGHTVLGVISTRRAYAPPEGKAPDRVGWMWCPYCVKYRPFEFLQVYAGEVLLPPELRCPVCTISIGDYWVRFHNPLMAARFLHLGAKNV